MYGCLLYAGEGKGSVFFITQTRLHDGEGTPQRPIEKRQRLFKNFGLGMKTVENRLKKKRNSNPCTVKSARRGKRSNTDLRPLLSVFRAPDKLFAAVVSTAI